MPTSKTKAAKKPYRPKISEAELQAAVIDMAETLGYHVFHLPDWLYTLAIKAVARGRGKAWSPPGFPDLVLMQGLHDERRPVRLIFAELKSDTGRLRVPQHNWLRGLQRIPGIEVYVWRPDVDYSTGIIERILRNGPMPSHEGTAEMMTRKPEEYRRSDLTHIRQWEAKQRSGE